MTSPVAEHDAQQPNISTDDARQGEATGHVRYVLGASMFLAVMAGAILYLIHLI